MNALQIARQEKKRIEALIRDELDAFTMETGLVVRSIDADRIDVTSVGDHVEQYVYGVSCEIEVS